MKKKIYLCRHAETIWNLPENKHLQGWQDSDLSAYGKQQSLLLKEILLELNITKVYTSPLLRCLKTLEPFLKTKNISCTKINQLKEINYGLYDGMLSQEARIKYKDFFFKYDDKNNPESETLHFPEGESRRDAAIRFFKALNIIIKKHDNCLVMTHGGILAAFFSLLFKQNRNFKNCEIVILYYDTIQKKFINGENK